MHMTNRSQCETEESHKCSPEESLVPRVTTNRRSSAHGVCTDPVDTEDPQCGGSLPCASRMFGGSYGH